MVTTPEIFSAVWFGLASFFTPCMLHVIPGYLSYLMGNTISEMEENSRVKMKLWINSFGFVLGLMIIFISLGLVATGFGKYLTQNKTLLKNISGTVIIFFGIFQLGFIHISFLNREIKSKVVYENVTFFRSILVGAMFGFAWTPCVGPMLTSILALAATLETVKQGGLLLFFYAVGYSTPFIVMSFFARSVMPFIKKMGKYLPMIKIATGVILIIIGLDILGFGVFHLDHDHDHENEASYENGIDLEEKTGIFENDVAKEIYFTNGEDLFFKLSDFRGKKVVLNFFATWCPPCMMELPELSAYYEEMKSVEDLEFIFLDLYAEEAGLSKSEIERFLADKEIRLNLFFDDEGIANETYGVAYIPTTLLIDENGKILLRKTGMIEVDEIKGIFSK